AVNAIFEAVRAAAKAIIDAGVAFVCEAIKAYGEFAKFLIRNTIGVVFPQLAEKLCQAVDVVVDVAQKAVRAIGELLKKGVDLAIDAAKAAVNAVLDAYEAAINIALDLMTAVLTGNWEDILLKALEVLLKLAGIDPGAFYALIGKAKESLKAILADPKSFGMNLIKAVAQGFSQFGKNFLKHFQEQFFNWLFSTSGITMPKDPFSVA